MTPPRVLSPLRDIWALREAAHSDESLQLTLERSEAWGQGWGTHVPLLAAALATAPPGPVLELGSGHFSSLVLIEMCRAMNRRLTIVESNLEWRRKAQDIAHAEAVDADWKLPLEIYRTRDWAFIFLDSQPDSLRLKLLRWAGTRAQRIVVHDTRNPYFEGLDEELDLFKYRYDYDRMASVTSVVSDTIPYP